MTETTRLLLPFTHGVAMDTIEAAVLLAASHHATLVPLSLILSPQTRGKGVRLEHIQQSKDFLEVVQHKALRHGVPLERFEVFTSDVLQSIAVLVHQLSCDGVVLALRGRNGSLLGAETIEQLMGMRACPLYLMYLSSQESSWVSRLRERFSRWWPGQRQRADMHVQLQPAPEERGTQDVALTQHAGSPDLER
jgi:hypothetical protein